MFKSKIFKVSCIFFVLLFAVSGGLYFSLDGALHNLKDKKNYTYNLAIAAIFQNDAPYIKEWIEFHNIVGVEHFLLFNNLSSDGTLDVLQPYIDSGLVELFNWPGSYQDVVEWNRIQCGAYSCAISHLKGRAKWVAFIDTDEFLFPVKKQNLNDFLAEFNQEVAVGVNWQTFGTSWVDKVPNDKLMIDLLYLKAPADTSFNIHIKSIVRPEAVAKCNNPHYFHFKQNLSQVNSDHVHFAGPFSPYLAIDKVRINHYTLRDQYFMNTIKKPRWLAWGKKLEKLYENEKELNQVADYTIQKYVKELKKRIFQ